MSACACRVFWVSWFRGVVTLCLIFLVFLWPAIAAGPDDKPGWLDFGGGPAASHFVRLDQITKSNVNELGGAWFYPYAAAGFNPIVVDDVIYVLGRNNALIALDAASIR
jgi:glucose dehydrogenase